ncbi:MAG: hypothetical protein GY791_00075 [Alphaproteobacteria bacterium]|nr:hypothetical protein [Alphaproteobacteria bacterium]
MAGGHPAGAIIFGGLFVFFAIFGFRVLQRVKTTIAVDEEGISTSGARGANLRWKDVEEVRLSYFSTRRDQAGGWMQLVLKGGAGQVCVESTLEGFDEIAQQAARAARQNGIVLTPATISNFSELGIDMSEDQAR